MSTHDLAQDDQQRNRPYSIDLSLELERQLDNESLPPTPAAPIRPQSIDQTVLTSLVIQLRGTLSEVTSERDHLRTQLAKAESDKTGAEEALHQFTTKCAQMEDELEAAKAKMADDELAINMLRTKVEESRRGLMRLQTENRQIGQRNMSIDTSRGAFSTPSSSKRASFTPLTGTRMNGHQRISSISDSVFLSSLSAIKTPGSPDSQTITLPDLSSSTSSRPPVSSRRFSGVFGHASPPNPHDFRPHDSLVEEMEALRQEMKAAKAELEETRHELSEANEAREASETCAKALRDFIAQTKGAASDSELTKLPQQVPAAKPSEEKKSVSGWGAFRMWKMEPPVKIAASEPPRKLWKVDTSVAAAPSSTEAATSASSLSLVTPTATAPFTTKVGGFFSSRAGSVSSAAPPPSRSLPSCDSDTSSTEESVIEPISPMSSIASASVMVRGSDASPLSQFDLPESMKNMPESYGNILSTPTL